MRAAIYARVSSQRQAEKWSLGAQRKILAEHANKQGWSSTVYDEGAASGETIADRPVMRRLLADVAGGRVDVILVIEWERLCRASDLIDLATITGACRRAGVLIATPERTFDLAKAEDDFESDLRGILGKREKRKLLERCARGRAEAKDAGKWLGGRAPWGYRYDKEAGTLAIIKGRDRIVREVFASEFGGRTLHANYRAKGLVISEYTLHRMRRNLTYAGKMKNSKGQIIDGAWPPIVTWQEWQAAQPAIEARRTGRPYQAKYLLTGLMRCAGCGGPIVSRRCGSSMQGDRRASELSYICKVWQRRLGPCAAPGSIAGWAAEILVLDAWERLVSDRTLLRTGYDALLARQSPDPEGGRTIASEEALRSLALRRHRLLDALEEGVVAHSDIRDRLREIDAQTALLEAEKDREARARANSAVLPWRTLLAQLRAFPEAPTPQRRLILRAFAESMILDFGERRLAVSWRFGEHGPMLYRLPNLHSLVNRTTGTVEAQRRLQASVADYREL